MKPIRRLAARTLAALAFGAGLALALPAAAEEPALEPGFESLFDGKTLTGWGYRTKKTLEKRESFDGLTASSDGRFVAEDGVLRANPRPEGKPRGRLFTLREFPGDFVLRFDFRASLEADSGVYLRKPQLQVRDYVSAGPYFHLRSYVPQGWNRIEVTVKGRSARATCNGEEIEAAIELPASGPIGIESDRGMVEYRRIRVKELP